MTLFAHGIELDVLPVEGEAQGKSGNHTHLPCSHLVGHRQLGIIGVSRRTTEGAQPEHGG